MRVYDDEKRSTIIEIEKIEVKKEQKEIWLKLEDGFEIDIRFDELDNINQALKKAYS